MTYKPSSSSLTNQFWSQATWFIDPTNSTGFASDSNTGIDATHPVLSYNGGVVAKWGTTSPYLRQDTMLTWLSSQSDDTDPVLFTPVMVNAVATFQGSIGASQEVGSGALTGVVPKNRAAGQILEADLGFAAPIGTLLHNTTSGKDSYAWVYKNVGGTIFQLTQPMVPGVLPFTLGTSVAEVDTWANGDTFVAYAPLAVNFVRLDPLTAEFDGSFAFPVQIYHLRASCADGVVGDDNLEIETNVTLVESIFDSVPLYQKSCDDLGFFWSNCFFGAGTFGQASGFSGEMYGGAIIANADVGSSLICWSLNNDIIIDTTAVGESLYSCPNAVASFSQVCIVGELAILSDLSVRSAFGAIIWGPGILNVIGLGRVFYDAGTASATFINLGGIEINGLTDANAFDPTTGLWKASISITGANLDLSIVGGGFGGMANIPGGATITSRGTA